MHSAVLEDISSTLFDLSNLGIDFSPNKMLKEDKYPLGWLAVDFNKVQKVWYYL